MRRLLPATVDGMTGSGSAGGDDIHLTARKAVAYLPVSNELLMELGFIPDTRPPPPPIPWRRRLRWRMSEARDKLAGRAYRMIAGHEIYHGDDY